MFSEKCIPENLKRGQRMKIKGWASSIAILSSCRRKYRDKLKYRRRIFSMDLSALRRLEPMCHQWACSLSCSSRMDKKEAIWERSLITSPWPSLQHSCLVLKVEHWWLLTVPPHPHPEVLLYSNVVETTVLANISYTASPFHFFSFWPSVIFSC